MSQINAIVINITLDGQNYPEWAFFSRNCTKGDVGYFLICLKINLCLKMIVVMLMLLEPGRLMMEK